MAVRGKRSKVDDVVRVAGKAANGAGSIYFDGKAYRATYIDPTSGKRRTVSGRTKGEVTQRRDDKLAELGTQVSGNLGADATVSAVAQQWLDTVAAVQVRPSTLHTYGKDVARIVSHFDTASMSALDSTGVRAFLADLRAQGLSASTTRNARARLRQIAEHAVELGYLPTNPVSLVRAPVETATERKQRRTLSPDETRRLLGTLDGTRTLDAAIALLFTSGLRVSEVLGLAWADLDLEAGTAMIRRGATYTGGNVGIRLDRPKTERTSGLVHLSPTAVRLLRARKAAQAAHRLAAGEVWTTTTYEGVPVELVFTSRTGDLLPRQNVTTHLHRRAEAAGIDTVGLATHSGRRTVVTNLFRDGLDLDDVAGHVGHGSTDTTRGYVQDLGNRPAMTASRAASLLDPLAADS